MPHTEYHQHHNESSNAEYNEYNYKKVLLFRKTHKTAKTDFNIELCKNTLLSLKNTLQEKAYFQDLETLGHPRFYQLIPHAITPDSKNPKKGSPHMQQKQQTYDVIKHDGEKVLPSDILPVYAFVILEVNGRLELRLGNNSHCHISNRAPSVKAAGDIYLFVDNHGIQIDQITDQSGGYHILPTDVLASEKRQSAYTAMRSVGLPMQKFKSYRMSLFLEQSNHDKNLRPRPL